jgi:hypothetical protein
MEVLVLDGKNYVKASKAASTLGYASDYVGQLCRSGQVDAHLIGRTWYVNQDELGSHKVEKKRISRVKAREHAKRSIEEHRLKVGKTQNVYKNIDIQYETDDEKLIPETRRINVQTLSPQKRNVQPEENYDNKTTVINKGEKILMSGDLEVVDVTDGPVDNDTVFLSPGRIRKGRIIVPPLEPEIPQEDQEQASDDEIQVDEPEESLRPMAFINRLNREEVPEEPESKAIEAIGTEVRTVSVPSIGACLLVLLLVVLLTALTLPLSRTLNYESSTPNQLDTSVILKIDTLKEKILQKI